MASLINGEALQQALDDLNDLPAFVGHEPEGASGAEQAARSKILRIVRIRHPGVTAPGAVPSLAA